MGLKVSPRATGLLAQTYSLKDYYSDYGVKNIEVINMFVDMSRFENLKIDKSVKYIGYCGTISRQKDGVDELDFVHFVSFSACVRCFLCPFFILGIIAVH